VQRRLAPVIRVEHLLLSKADPVDSLYIAFEMLQMFKDQPLRFAHRVATGDCLLWYDPSEVNTFNMIPHLRNTAKQTHLLLVALRFVANAKGALGLGTDKREQLKIR
jgi:hypothetical protein